MQRYKDWLGQERVPHYEKYDESRTASYAMMNTPTASYKSTATMEALEDYLTREYRIRVALEANR